MKTMKKNIIIIIAVIVLVFLGIGGIRTYPNFMPLHVPMDPFHGYSYTVYKDHVELDKYYGNKEEVSMPDTLWGRPVTVISSECFIENETIQKVILPKDLETIKENAFEKCKNLQEIEKGEQVRFIGAGAFFECKSLCHIGGLGSSVEKIGNGAFSGCGALTYFPFTENLKILLANAFEGSGLETVDEVKSIEFMYADVFEGTPWLKRQTEDFVTYSDILIWYQGTDKRIVIPEGIRGIALHFYQCEGMEAAEEVVIPSSVEYILINSFLCCDGVRIYIPKEVEKLGYVVSFEGKEFMGSIGNVAYGTIVTTAGSPAEKHAKEYGYSCEIVDD